MNAHSAGAAEKQFLIPRILLPKLSKTMLNIYLDEMGLFQSEIGFPTLKHEVNYINANLELVKLGAINPS
jgi:homocitrate synthase NifV